MNENLIIEKQYQSLLIYYVLVFVEVILIGVASVYLFDAISFAPETKTGLQSLGVLSMMIMMPLGLMLFNKKTKPIDEMEELIEAWALYRKWWLIRAALIVAALLINTILFILTRDTSLFYCAMMLLVAWFFCKPNQLKQEEKTAEKNDQI